MNKEKKQAGLDAIEEAKKNGKWDKAYSSHETPIIPEDLQKELEAEPLALENFNNFSNSLQQRFIYWINDAKKPETRKRRITKTVEKARENFKPTINSKF